MNRVDRFKEKMERLAAEPRGEEYVAMIALLMDALLVSTAAETKALTRVPERDFEAMMAWARTVLARRS